MVRFRGKGRFLFSKPLRLKNSVQLGEHSCFEIFGTHTDPESPCGVLIDEGLQDNGELLLLAARKLRSGKGGVDRASFVVINHPTSGAKGLGKFTLSKALGLAQRRKTLAEERAALYAGRPAIASGL